MSVIETATSYFEQLIQSDEFYFQKGKDALKKWMDLYLSDEGQIKLQNLLEDYTTFAEIKEGHQFFSIKEILFSIISYCDIHARGKAFYNQYDDKRVLAKAGVRMKPWVINTFNYKYHKDDVNITVKNALDMLAMPENNINSIALSHRELISNHYLNHSYNPDTFVSELKEKFSNIDKTKNPENQTLLIAAHIYDQKKEWDKKQMDFKTFIANLKEYAEKNQLEYDFGNLNGNNIWIFDKEQYFNHKRAHYEVIIKKGSISVDLHFEDGHQNAEKLRALLGELPTDTLEWKKWHFGNSVSHIKKFTLSDEDLVEKVVECLDELYDATSEKLIDVIKNMNSELTMNTVINHPLNQILYGPPGTGKTYNTINKAIQIANPSFILSDHTRKEIKAEYKKLVDEGRIVFTTFHQSMSYEDFIEGIKPKIKEDEKGNKKVIYDIEDGIFKRIAEKAKKPRLKDNHSTKSYTFDEAWNDLVLDAAKHLENKKPLVLQAQKLDAGQEITEILADEYITLKPIYSKSSNPYKLKLSVLKELQQAFPDLSKVKNVSIEFRKLVSGNVTAYWSVLNYINNKIKEKSVTIVQEETLPPLPHVLIIDEINRGNVSQIFGELITLIEEDKRLGNNEALEIILPYSKKEFGVPSNLYIIGTMNTADRSVEALDTALRRRFSFEEMPPKPQILNPSNMIESLFWEYKSHGWTEKEYKAEEDKLFSILDVSEKFKKEKEGIWERMKENKKNKIVESGYFERFEYGRLDFEKLLTTINNRIEKLIDKDHAIGHAYFIGKDNETIIDSFYKNIIPLLQEYFFGDYGKIGLVLGRGFVKKKDPMSSVFAAFHDYENEYSDRESYEIIDYRKPNTISDNGMTFIEAINLLMN